MKKSGMVNGVGLGVGGMAMGMPDPINALQTLARQGTKVLTCRTVEQLLSNILLFYSSVLFFF